MDNPIKKFRERKEMSKNRFANKIGTYGAHLRIAENIGVHTPEDIICKIGLVFEEANEGKMLKEYYDWSVGEEQ